jgi:hypothetical protein
MKKLKRVNSLLSFGLAARMVIWFCFRVEKDEIRPTNNDTGIVAFQHFTNNSQREGGD